jgi:hypothetical protein
MQCERDRTRLAFGRHIVLYAGASANLKMSTASIPAICCKNQLGVTWPGCLVTETTLLLMIGRLICLSSFDGFSRTQPTASCPPLKPHWYISR